MNLRSALEALIAFEDEVSAFYRWLSTALDDSEAAALFARVAQEESGHAEVLRRQLGTLTDDLAALPMEGVSGAIQISIDAMETFRRESPHPEPTLAAHFAMGLEAVGGEALGRNTLRKWAPRLAQTLEHLDQEDARHLKLLESFLESRG